MYKCDKCDKTYLTNFALKNHKSSVHEKKKYPCDICGKEFYCEKWNFDLAHSCPIEGVIYFGDLLCIFPLVYIGAYVLVSPIQGVLHCRKGHSLNIV